MPYKRKDIYYVDLRPAGYGKRVGPLSTRVTQKALAQQMEATIRELATTGRHELLDDLREGKYSLPDLHAARVAGTLTELREELRDPPLAEEVDEFLKDRPDPRYKTALKRVLTAAPAGARFSWILNTENLKNHAKRLRELGLAPATEKREFAAISCLITSSRGDAARVSALKPVNLRKVKNGRDLWLNGDQIKKLKEVSGHWWLIIEVAISTGMRRGELLALRVRDVDIDKGVVRVQGGKTKRARRRIPIGGQALGDLSAWIETLEPDDLVFGHVTESGLRSAWERARSAAGLHEFTFHDLRHTYAVHCAKSGMPLGELKDRLGHEKIEMTARYAIYQPPIDSPHYTLALESMGVTESP